MTPPPRARPHRFEDEGNLIRPIPAYESPSSSQMVQRQDNQMLQKTLHMISVNQEKEQFQPVARAYSSNNLQPCAPDPPKQIALPQNRRQTIPSLPVLQATPTRARMQGQVAPPMQPPPSQPDAHSHTRSNKSVHFEAGPEQPEGRQEQRGELRPQNRLKDNNIHRLQQMAK